jgi:hypothetical protein
VPSYRAPAYEGRRGGDAGERRDVLRGSGQQAMGAQDDALIPRGGLDAYDDHRTSALAFRVETYGQRYVCRGVTAGGDLALLGAEGSYAVVGRARSLRSAHARSPGHIPAGAGLLLELAPSDDRVAALLCASFCCRDRRGEGGDRSSPQPPNLPICSPMART